MIGWFMKIYLHKPIKILQLFSREKIQNFLTQLRNILAISESRIYEEIFLHVIPVPIIVLC